MISRYIFSSFLFLFVVQSCFFSDCEKVSLSNEEKEWFNVYKDGDLVHFTSDLKESNYFKVQKYNSYTECNKIEISNQQFESCTFNLLHMDRGSNDKSEIYFQFVANEDDYGCDVRLSVFDLQNRQSKYNNLHKKMYINKNNLTVITFDRVLDTDIIQTESSLHSLKSFQWSKEMGLIQYTTLDGEKFRLVSINSGNELDSIGNVTNITFD